MLLPLFEHCITIASACNLVFRTNYLDPESLAIIPSHGYRSQHNQSNKAVKWLKYMCTRENNQIQHALNAGEMQIGPFTVDDHQENAAGDKIVYEFMDASGMVVQNVLLETRQILSLIALWLTCIRGL